MSLIAWIMWGGILVGVSLLYWWLWSFAKRIEQDELLEAELRQYDENMESYLAWLWQTDPQSAYYMQAQYEQEKANREA